MKLFLIPWLVMLSCGSAKKNQATANADSVMVTTPVVKTVKDSVTNASESVVALPTCIKNKIDSFKVKQVHERPQKVVEYQYKGKRVYYIVMPCCDFFNEVYDDKCKLLGSPDGGFTGRGDGKLPDFFKEVSKEKIIWESDK